MMRYFEGKIGLFMKRIKLLRLLLLSIGIVIIIYPQIRIFYNDLQLNIRYKFYKENQSQKVNAKKKQFFEAYNQTLQYESQPLQDPFSEGISNSIGVEDNEVIGYLEIPDIAEKLPIYVSTSERQLRKGVGVISQTSFPIGGKSTHSALAGHRGYAFWRIFRNVNDLQIGMSMYIHIAGETHQYQIYEKEVINPAQSEKLKIVKGKDLVTLVTCHPLGSNAQRLLIKTERVAMQKEDQQQEQKKDTLQTEEKVEKRTHKNFFLKKFVPSYKIVNRIFLFGGMFFLSILLFLTIRIFVEKKRE